jgi:flagellar hook protein FlgE
LYLQQTRLSASASNVANANTEGYQPYRVTAEARADGGVAAHVSRADGPLSVAGGEGAERTLSGTNLVQERVNQVVAVTQYRANMAVIATDNQLHQTMLDLLG